MNQKLELAQHKFIGTVGKFCDSFGLNKLVAQLYALLYLSEKPLSLDEMADKLKVSKGSISLNIRELEKWGAVRSIWVKGSRKDYYEADLDIKKVVFDKVKKGLEKRLAEVGTMTDEFNAIVSSTDNELDDTEKAIAQVYAERMKKIEELKALAVSGLNLAEKML